MFSETPLTMTRFVLSFVCAISLTSVHASHLAHQFPDNPSDTNQCRLVAHATVFDLFPGTVDVLSGDDNDSSSPHASLCKRVLNTPQLRCVIASSATRCRLRRAKVSARGNCDASSDCETCVMREIGQGVEYREDCEEGVDDDEAINFTEDYTIHSTIYSYKPSSLNWKKTQNEHQKPTEFPKIHRTMEWQIYLQELDEVEKVCRDFETAYRAEHTSRVLQRVLQNGMDAEKRNEKLHAEAFETASAVLKKVNDAKKLAETTVSRLTSIESMSLDITNSIAASERNAKQIAAAHSKSLKEAQRGLDVVMEIVTASVANIKKVSRKVRSVFDILVSVRNAVFDVRETVVTAVHKVDAMLLELAEENDKKNNKPFTSWFLKRQSESNNIQQKKTKTYSLKNVLWSFVCVTWRVIRVLMRCVGYTMWYVASLVTWSAKMVIAIVAVVKVINSPRAYRLRQKYENEKRQEVLFNRHEELFRELNRELRETKYSLQQIRREKFEAVVFEPRGGLRWRRREKKGCDDTNNNSELTQERTELEKTVNKKEPQPPPPPPRTSARVWSPRAKG